MRNSLQNVQMPTWAGLTLVPIIAYILNNYILTAIPFLGVLPDLGALPYFTTGAGVIGVWMALRGRDDNAVTCEELSVMLGLAGTMIGLTQYLTAWQSNATDIGGLLYVFITGFHGVIMAAIIKFILLWRVDEDDGIETWDATQDEET